MFSLGIYTGPHDPAACLVADGRVVAAIEEERLTRVKYGTIRANLGLWEEYGDRFGYFPWSAIAYCLQAAGIGLDDVDRIVLADDYLAPMAALNIPVRDPERIVVARDPAGCAHHYMHALSAFYASDFDEAAVLVVDGDGTWTDAGYEAESAYVFDRDGGHRTVQKNRYVPLPTGGRVPHLFHSGLGWMYEYVTGLLGFSNVRAGVPDAGKTMGLAPYGGPSSLLAGKWFHERAGHFDFRPFLDWIVSAGYVDYLDDRSFKIIEDPDRISAYAMDLAWKAQSELERGLLALAAEVRRRTGRRYLCLAGGVGLNAVANGVLARAGIFDRVFVQPAAGDNGQAIGLAYHGYVTAGKARTLTPIRDSYTGTAYATEEILAHLQALRIPAEVIDGDLAEHAAAELADGAVLGWFQGGSEFGPRALGHRSILADPRPEDMKDRINERVKMREMFRPFAPSVLSDLATEVFDISAGADLRFMLSCCGVREEWQKRIPAVCHVDGTARVQVVDAGTDQLYYELISRFHRLTGVPLVLNTSLNVRGMPLVETPADALQCLLSSDLDALYLHNIRVVYPPHASLHVRLADGWSLAGATGGATVRHARTGRALDVTEDGAALLDALDDGRTLHAATVAAGIGPDPDGARRTAGALLRRGYRAGALSVDAGGLPFDTRWTFGRLPRGEGSRPHSPFAGPIGPDGIRLPRSVGR
ncbi:carbamoyltransferase C-terminal domain-containing protein [Plantactinospora sp. B6F1]|uniref:carbamoyltransferase family protein n=1 Tax=Plantactinospora sp. B6F1 TaxID=3158971 RepID=UPI0032D95CF4